MLQNDLNSPEITPWKHSQNCLSHVVLFYSTVISVKHLPRVCSTTHPTQCRFCFELMFRGTTIQQNLRMSITCTCAFLRNLTTCITCMMLECAPAAPYKSALHVGAVYVCAWKLPSTVDGFGFLSCVFAEHSNQKEYLFIESILSEAWPKLFGKVWQL